MYHYSVVFGVVFFLPILFPFSSFASVCFCFADKLSIVCLWGPRRHKKLFPFYAVVRVSFISSTWLGIQLTSWAIVSFFFFFFLLSFTFELDTEPLVLSTFTLAQPPLLDKFIIELDDDEWQENGVHEWWQCGKRRMFFFPSIFCLVCANLEPLHLIALFNRVNF